MSFIAPQLRDMLMQSQAAYAYAQPNRVPQATPPFAPPTQPGQTVGYEFGVPPTTLSSGAYRGTPISYDSKNPDSTLSQITNRDQARFESIYRPIQQTVIGSLGDRSIIDAARTSVTGATDNRVARTARQMSRYGLQQSPVQAAQAQRDASLGATLNFDSTVNDARLEQKERNDGLRRELIDIGRGVSDTSKAGLGDATGLQASRDANNTAAKAAAKAQNTQMLASMAMMAIMFA